MDRPAWLILAVTLLGCGKETHRLDPGPWTNVSVGKDHACALAKDGRARCWGVTASVGGPYRDLVAGWGEVCGLLQNGGAQCVSPQTGQIERAVEGEFVSLAAGADKLCGLTATGSAVCSGVASSVGPYAAIDAGSHAACGIRSDGSIVCWSAVPPESPDFIESRSAGESEYTIPSGVYPGAFVQVAVGYQHVCALTAAGEIQCWGQLEAQAPTGNFLDIQSSENACCGLQADGAVACWGDNVYGILDVPSGPFVSLSVGRNRACALRAERTLSCWGAGYDPGSDLDVPHMGKLELPLDALGSLRTVEVGDSFDCGLAADGIATCFLGGDPAKLQVPNETWSMIAAGERQSCGLTEDGRAICWGQGREGEPGPADERFVSVAAGAGISCGLHADGSVSCWGQDCPQNCQLDGSFSAIDAADSLCGAGTEGGIECIPRALQDFPRDTRYRAVASGWGIRGFGPLNVCGLDAAGRINCDNASLFVGDGYQHVSVALTVVLALDASGELVLGTGDATALGELPSGPFIDVDLGTDYGNVIPTPNWGCAVRADGHLECFGHTSPSRLMPPEAPE